MGPMSKKEKKAAEKAAKKAEKEKKKKGKGKGKGKVMETELDSPKPPADETAENPLADAALGELADLADLEIPDDDSDFGHVWQKDADAEECNDCGMMVDTWCKHCEACKHCND